MNDAIVKKCKPLRCTAFGKVANQIETRQLVDKIVVNCPYRLQNNSCTNIKETFKGVHY